MPGTRQRRSGADAAVEHVTSADGTHIAYVKAGYGPPLVLVHGTAAAHWSFRFLVPLLIERFTVYTVDRRGRGESGDAAEYAIEREFADVVAVVDSIAEPASVFGHSFGATLAGSSFYPPAAAGLAASLAVFILLRLVLRNNFRWVEVRQVEQGMFYSGPRIYIDFPSAEYKAAFKALYKRSGKKR